MAVKLPLSGKWVERGDFTDAELDAIDREYLRGKGLVPPSDPTQGPPQPIQGPPPAPGTIGERGVEFINQTVGQIPGIPDLTPEGARGVLEATGSGLGLVAGGAASLAAPAASPALLAGLEGLGAAGGSLLAESIGLGETGPSEILPPIPLGDITGDPRLGEVSTGPLERAARAGLFGAAASTVGQAIPGALSAGARALAKADEKMIALSGKFGIAMDLETAGQRAASRFYRNIIGKFPYQAEAFKQATQRRGKAVLDAFDMMMDGLARPSDHANLSRRAVRGARAGFEAFIKEADIRFAALKNFARDRGITVGQDMWEVSLRDIVERVGAADGGDETEIFKYATRRLRDIAKFREKFGDGTPRTWTFEQFDTTRKLLVQELKKARKDHRNADMSEFMGLLNAMDQELDLVGDTLFQEELRSARAFYKAGAELFENPTAQKFGRVFKNIFERGFEEAGSINEDELIKSLIRGNSPDVVRDLRNLLLRSGTHSGRSTFNRIIRETMETRLANAMEVDRNGQLILREKLLGNQLGLNRPRSVERATTKEMLRDTGLKVEDLEDFVTVLARIGELRAVDVSTFVARRATLGGFQTMMKSFTQGSSAAKLARESGGNPLRTAGIVLLKIGETLALRKMGTLLASPEFLRDYVRAVDPAMSRNLRIQALLHMGRTFELGVDREEGLFGEIPTLTGPAIAGAGAALQSFGPASLTGATSAGLGAVGPAALAAGVAAGGQQLQRFTQGDPRDLEPLRAFMQETVLHAARELFFEPGQKLKKLKAQDKLRPVIQMTPEERRKLNQSAEAKSIRQGTDGTEGLSDEALIQLIGEGAQ